MIDSWEFLQTEIDAASQQQIPYTIAPGRYYINQPLQLKTNAIISGNGPNFSTVIQPNNCQAFVIDGDNVIGGWAFKNNIKNLTIDSSTTEINELIKINKTYSTEINNVFIFNQKTNIGVNITNSNFIIINNSILNGTNTTIESGIIVNGIENNTSVVLNNVDIENYSRGLKTIGDSNTDLHSCYMERCIVNIDIFNDSSVNLFGGFFKSINGYNIGLRSNNFNVYSAKLESYNGTRLNGKIIYCFERKYQNVSIKGVKSYPGYLNNTNCPKTLFENAHIL